MLEQYEIENVEQLRAIADLLRLRIVDMLLKQPMTVTQLGEMLGEAPAKVHYHVRELEKVGLLRLVETREKGGILEKYYQPIAREFSVEKSLISAPPDEAIAMMSAMLSQVKDGFLRAFRQALEQKNEKPNMTIGFSRLYLTAEDQKQLARQMGELLKSYEKQRNIEGEREFLASILLYPEAPKPATLPEVPSLLSTHHTQVVGAVNYGRADLEKILAEGKRLDINVVGICRFADDVSPELADRAIEHLYVIGKLFAPSAVREILMQKSD
jgi:DNA-binding transcriptional ArsR family regulator